MDEPTTGDREQQRADNVASRRQSGLEPRPEDRPVRKDGDGTAEPPSPSRPESDDADDAEERG